MDVKAFITLLGSIFIAVLGIGIIIPVMPVYAQSLGAGGFALGMIIAAFSVSRSCLQPLIGNMSDKVGRKRFMIVGLFIYAVAGLLIPQAETVWQLILIRLFHGSGSGMIVPVAMAYISNLTPEGQEGRYMGFLNTAIFLGMGCGPIVGGLFFDSMGPDAAFYAMAFMCLVASFMIIFFLPTKERATQKKVTDGVFASMVKMFRDRHTFGVLLARYGTMIVMVPSLAFLPLFMQEHFEARGAVVGMVIACRTFVNAALQFPFGKFADTYNKLVLLMIGVVLMVVAIASVPSATSIYHLFISYMLLGCGEALVWPTLGAYASEKGRAQYGHGTMMGVLSFAMSVGVLTGAIIAGISMDYLGIEWSFYVPAIAILMLSFLGGLLICKNAPIQRDA